LLKSERGCVTSVAEMTCRGAETECPVAILKAAAISGAIGHQTVPALLMHPAVNDTPVGAVVGNYTAPAERDKYSTEVIWAGSLSHTMTYVSVPDRDYRRQEG